MLKHDRSGQRKVHKHTMPKAYWSILNTILNNKKIPSIPPLNVNGKIISNFEKKAELFNLHFASQCTPINNSSVLLPLEYKTNGRLASVHIKDDIYLILKNLNPEKAHGLDNISIRKSYCGTFTNFIFVFFRIGRISR